MAALFKFILIVVLIWLLLGWLIKPLLRMLLGGMVKKMMKNGNGQFYYKEYTYSSDKSQNQKKEGSLKVDYVPPKSGQSRISDSDGEYVDYEEVK